MTTTTIDPATIEGFAREWVEYRLGGCPDGFLAGFKARVTKAARRAGVSYATLVAPIHREAYRLIDADPRGRLMSQGS